MADKVKPYKISPREIDRFDRIKRLYLGKSGFKKISKEVLKANFDWLSKFYNANIESIININTIIPIYLSRLRALVIKYDHKSRVDVDEILNKFYRVDKLTKDMNEQRITIKQYEEILRQKQEVIGEIKPVFLEILQELKILKDTTFKCAKEIVNFIIDDCNGIYTDDKIRELVVSSFLVSLALITAHDLHMHNVQNLFMNECNISLIKKMQIDILDRTDYQGCKKTIGLNYYPPIPSPNQSPKQSPKSPKQSPKKSPKTPPKEWLLMFDKDQDVYYYNKWLNIKNTYPPLDTNMSLYKKLNIKINEDYIMRILDTGEPYYKHVKNNTHSMQPPVDMKKLFPFGIELFLDSRNVPTYLVRKE